MIKFVIYKILCKVNNKFYIGSASWYSKRKDKHLWGLRRNTHANKYLQNAFNKYGEENFEFSIVEQCNKENLIEREQFWLDITNCYDRRIGFNILKIAESSLGRKMPKSGKIKIGNFWRGKKFSEQRIKELKERTTKNQGKAILVFDKDDNLIYEFPSISETSRQLGISIGAISKQCSQKLQGRFKKRRGKYIFKYKDIV